MDIVFRAMGGAVVLVLAALFEGGCASMPAGQATVPLTAPCDDCVRGVTNFAKVSPALWRGSQPTAEGFRNLEKDGVRTVINVRHDHDDAKLLTGTKLKYVWIPMRPLNPTEEDLIPFFRVIQDPANWPVFIHCWKGNDRVGFYVAAYRIVIDGWNSEDAIREMVPFHYSPLWFRIPHVLRQIDVDKLKARIAAR